MANGYVSDCQWSDSYNDQKPKLAEQNKNYTEDYADAFRNLSSEIFDVRRKMMTDDESMTNDEPNVGENVNGVAVKLRKIFRSIVRTFLFTKLDRPTSFDGPWHSGMMLHQITYYRTVEEEIPLVFKGVFALQNERRPRGMPSKGYQNCLGHGPVNPCIMIEIRDQEDYDSMVVDGTKPYDKLIPLIAYHIFQNIKRRSQEEPRPYCLFLAEEGPLAKDTLKPQDVLLTGPLAPQISTGNVVALSLDQLRFSDPSRDENGADRWYVAPEALYQRHDGSSISDMWSAGLILAELVTQRRIVSGRYCYEKLELNSVLLLRRSRPTASSPVPAIGLVMNHWVPPPDFESRNLKRELSGADPLLIDLISHLLVVNNERRMNIDEVFRHPFLTKFTDSLKAGDHKRFQRFWAFPDKDSIKMEESL
uniref:Protein kinase domain-containing protein n=1 Tax=Romanomermis culicivorax TaxID=13658 RepID=A0A915HHE1_ROMCU